LEITSQNLVMNQYKISFSICTLVKNKDNYSKLLESLKKKNFINDCDEILSIDNSFQNQHDCFSAIRNFVERGTNEYIVIVHDDVIFNNSRDELISQIKKIELLDDSVAVFGVAGLYKNHINGVGRFISNRGKEDWGFNNNGIVTSLDECFLIIKKSSAVTVSVGLTGFHFYGSDICLNASRNGKRCYVIDYPITHLSPGNLDISFLTARSDYSAHLSRVGFMGILSTTCTSIFVGNGFFSNAIANALAIAKPTLGKNPKAEYVRNQILKTQNSELLKLSVYVIFKSIIFYYYCVRIIKDICWWVKNWKSRMFLSSILLLLTVCGLNGYLDLTLLHH